VSMTGAVRAGSPGFNGSGGAAGSAGTASSWPSARRISTAAKEAAIRAALASGKGVLKVARELGTGSSTVQRVKAAMRQPVERRPDGDPQMSADHLDQWYPGRIGS